MVELDHYQRYRGQIETGDLILFESKDIVSKTIALFTKSTLTHAAMAKWIKVGGNKRLFVLESVLTGVCLNYLSNRVAWWLPHGHMYWHKVRDKHRRHRFTAADMLMQQVGTFYDFKNLIWQSVKRVTIDAKNFFCSEAVAWPWVEIYAWGNNFMAPYPHELILDDFGIYERKGERIT